LLRSASKCGDSAVCLPGEDTCFLALTDVLGHGEQARDVAAQAERFFLRHSSEDLLSVINGLHRCLAGTRGAVSSICRLNIKTGVLAYTGVGNVAMKLAGRQSIQLVTSDGVIGYGPIHPRVREQRIQPGTTLLLYSDGVSEHISFLECPGILHRSADEIANRVLDRFGTNSDDASCIVLKYLR